MGKSKRHRKFSKSPPKHKSKKKKSMLLEQTSVEEIVKLKKYGEKYAKFHWDYYFNLAYQRSKIADEIKQALLEAALESFEFTKWQRTIRLKHSNSPLSVRGSLKTIGGRFNIGDIDQPLIGPFPALYVSEDFDTGLQELFGQGYVGGTKKLAYSNLLASPKSFASIVLSGHLEDVIDLREPKHLRPFVNLIKGFPIPNYLKITAKEINEPVNLVATVSALMFAILNPDWRIWPMNLDVPAVSQIFGQVVESVGIEGIIYPSKFTGRSCIAIFPQNFDADESYIELVGDVPSSIKIKRIDKDVWKKHSNELQGF